MRQDQNCRILGQPSYLYMLRVLEGYGISSHFYKLIETIWARNLGAQNILQARSGGCCCCCCCCSSAAAAAACPLLALRKRTSEYTRKYIELNRID